jgi:hypothetical protein
MDTTQRPSEQPGRLEVRLLEAEYRTPAWFKAGICVLTVAPCIAVIMYLLKRLQCNKTVMTIVWSNVLFGLCWCGFFFLSPDVRKAFREERDRQRQESEMR